MTEYRIKGAWDEITTCGLCGKQGLKKTIIAEIVDGEGEGDGEIYVGSDCVAKLRTGRRDARAARKVEQEAAAANLRRANAVRFSREWLDWTESLTRPAFAGDPERTFRYRAVMYANANHMNLAWTEEQKLTEYRNSLARHATVVETGGMSIFS